MSRNDFPRPPDDLLARCLETIPATAIKSSAPRLFPDAGSRRRLAWLSVSAAVPVVTALAVLPLMRYLEAHPAETPLKESKSVAKDERVPYLRITSWKRILAPDSSGHLALGSKRQYMLTLCDTSDGCSIMHTRSDYRPIPGSLARSETKDGTYQFRLLPWNQKRNLEAVKPTFLGRLDSITTQPRPLEYWLFNRKQTRRSPAVKEFWKGKPVVSHCYDLSLTAIDPRHDIEFAYTDVMIDPKTRRVIVSADYIVWKKDPYLGVPFNIHQYYYEKPTSAKSGK